MFALYCKYLLSGLLNTSLNNKWSELTLGKESPLTFFDVTLKSTFLTVPFNKSSTTGGGVSGNYDFTHNFESSFYRSFQSVTPRWGTVQSTISPLMVLYPRSSEFVPSILPKDRALDYCTSASNPFLRLKTPVSRTPFYVQQWDFQKLNLTTSLSELFNLPSSLKNQTNIINMFR